MTKHMDFISTISQEQPDAAGTEATYGPQNYLCPVPWTVSQNWTLPRFRPEPHVTISRAIWLILQFSRDVT